MQSLLFFETYAPYAIDTMVKYGIPASITLSQAALESGWGESGLTKNANNFFGIKDFPDDDWAGANYVAYTKEYGSSGYYGVSAPFRKYATPLQSFYDHAKFLNKPRYQNLFSLNPLDYKSWAYGLQKDGYATAPNYGQSLINMIEDYDLSKYDQQAEKKKTLYFGLIGLILIIIIVLIALWLYNRSEGKK